MREKGISLTRVDILTRVELDLGIKRGGGVWAGCGFGLRGIWIMGCWFYLV